jgi:hypothetical protein
MKKIMQFSFSNDENQVNRPSDLTKEKLAG